MKILDRVYEHHAYYKAVNDKDYFVLALYGSQNYNLADEDSDVDTKILVIPTLQDLIFNTKPYNKVYEIGDKLEHIECKDIRNYFKIFRKQDINFIQILFTNYFIVNSEYQDLWNILQENREKIARLNEYRTVQCMRGRANNVFHNLDHITSTNYEKLMKYGIDPKQLSHLVRVYLFLSKYIEGKPYKDCIRVDEDRDYVISLKKNCGGYSEKKARSLALEYYKKIDSIVDSVEFKNEDDEETSALLDDVLTQIMTRSLRKELKNG